MTQSGGAKNTFSSVTLYNFQKSGRAIALPAPPPPRSLIYLISTQLCLNIRLLKFLWPKIGMFYKAGNFCVIVKIDFHTNWNNKELLNIKVF